MQDTSRFKNDKATFSESQKVTNGSYNTSLQIPEIVHILETDGGWWGVEGSSELLL